MWMVPFVCKFTWVQLAQWASFSNSIARTRTLIHCFHISMISCISRSLIHPSTVAKKGFTKTSFTFWHCGGVVLQEFHFVFFLLESYGQAVSHLWRDCNTWEKSKGGGWSSRDAGEGWTLNKAAVNIDLWSWRMFLFVLPFVLCGIWPQDAGINPAQIKIKEYGLVCCVYSFFLGNRNSSKKYI